MSAQISIDKASIRQQMLSSRQALSSHEIKKLSEKIFQNFLEKKEEILPVKNYQVIALYCPIKSEVDICPFFEYFQKQSKICVFPKTQESRLFFYEIKDLSELKKGSYQIPEPVPNGRPMIPDLIFVPGVAFDEQTFRLGFGRGFYDRTFETLKSSFLLGLAYDFQVVPSLPKESHDYPMDVVMTEKRLIFKRNK